VLQRWAGDFEFETEAGLLFPNFSLTVLYNFLLLRFRRRGIVDFYSDIKQRDQKTRPISGLRLGNMVKRVMSIFCLLKLRLCGGGLSSLLLSKALFTFLARQSYLIILKKFTKHGIKLNKRLSFVSNVGPTLLSPGQAAWHLRK